MGSLYWKIHDLDKHHASQNLQADKTDPNVFVEFDGCTLLLFTCSYHTTYLHAGNLCCQFPAA